METEPTDLRELTGLKTFSDLRKILDMVGERTSNVYYFPLLQPAKAPRSLCLADELFLTLIKLYKNYSFVELGQRFCISVADAASIFITWINLLYCVFDELDLALYHTRLMGTRFVRCKEELQSIVIHCVEIRILKPKNHHLQQLTYRHLGEYTVKVLIGVCACSTVVFVSKAHGGSISCEVIFERSKFPKYLDGNYSLHRRGDLKKKADFGILRKHFQNHFHIFASNKCANGCLSLDTALVTSLTGFFGILCDQLCTSDMSFAHRIICVCFMIANIIFGHIP